MREIKFRARKATGEWAYFTLDQVLRHNGVPAWVYEYPDIEKQLWTGLKDKNGTPIYEGDIMLDHFGIKSVVLWWDGTFVLGSILNGILNQFVDVEVIGNIYEHPHLLK